MTTPDAVLFDLDGVLVDSYRVWFRLMREGARRFGAPPIDETAFAEMWGQGVDADARILGRPVDEVERFFNENFMRFSDALEIDRAGEAVFAAIHAAGLSTAVVTNTPSPLARDILAAARLEPTALVGGTDVPCPKPAPDMVLAACGLLDTAPEAAVMIGDSAFDRDAAAAAGVRFIGLRTDGEDRIERLDELPGIVGARF